MRGPHAYAKRTQGPPARARYNRATRERFASRRSGPGLATFTTVQSAADDRWQSIFSQQQKATIHALTRPRWPITRAGCRALDFCL
jgi:hypothetical protein